MNYMKLNQFIKSSTHLSGRNVFCTLPIMVFILLHLICISTYIIAVLFCQRMREKKEKTELPFIPAATTTAC